MSKSVSFAIALALLVPFSSPTFAQLEVGQGQGNTTSIQNLIRPKTIFVTSMTYDGDLGGLEGADQKCQALADGPGSKVPTGQYVALLSTGTINASSRMTPSIGAVIRPDGTLVAGSFSELFRTIHGDAVGNLLAPPDMDELGNSLTTNLVWTGSSPSGLMRPDTCDDWTSDSFSDKGVSGIPNTRTASWIARESEPDACNNGFRLYCVGK